MKHILYFLVGLGIVSAVIVPAAIGIAVTWMLFGPEAIPAGVFFPYVILLFGGFMYLLGSDVVGKTDHISGSSGPRFIPPLPHEPDVPWEDKYPDGGKPTPDYNQRYGG